MIEIASRDVTFVCTLTETEHTGTIFTRDSGSAVAVPIGYDDEEDVSYSLLVCLDAGPGDILELRFAIVRYCGQTDSGELCWSGSETGFIPKDERKLVLAHIMCAVEHLLSRVKPEYVTVCTMDAYAPEKANTKFMILAETFRNCGYRVQTADPYYGVSVWWMERETR